MKRSLKFGFLLLLLLLAVTFQPGPLQAQCVGLTACLNSCAEEASIRYFLCRQVLEADECAEITEGYRSTCEDMCWWHMCEPLPI